MNCELKVCQNDRNVRLKKSCIYDKIKTWFFYKNSMWQCTKYSSCKYKLDKYLLCLYFHIILQNYLYVYHAKFYWCNIIYVCYIYLKKEIKMCFFNLIFRLISRSFKMKPDRHFREYQDFRCSSFKSSSFSILSRLAYLYARRFYKPLKGVIIQITVNNIK